MYTQCPACLTTFKVTPAQLAARGGVVRCGICSAIFHAEQRRLQVPPAAPQTAAPEPEDAPPPGTGQRRRTVKERRVTPRRRRDKIRSAPVPAVDEADFPIVTDRKMPAARPLLRAALWGLGNLALLLLLAGQFVFFYRDDLAGIPSWHPWVAEFCGYARCELRPLRDVAAIELLQTTIAPHPQYANALRIRTTLVNRAAFAQDYPGMEVSLTDNGGRVIARRTFTPAQYLPATAAGAMPPNVAVASLLDVTNPDTKAVGYEIRLVLP